MADNVQEQQPGLTASMSTRNFVSILVLGGVTGLLVWGLGHIFTRYVFEAILCRKELTGQCTNAYVYANVLSIVVANIIALLFLIQLRIYRPLLIVSAVVIGLWGLPLSTLALDWYWGVLILGILFLLSYGIFAWVARIYKFWLALGVMLLLIFAVRLTLSL